MPGSFHMNAKWNDRERVVELLFGGAGTGIQKIYPLGTMVENPPVEKNLTSNTIDPLTMALQLMNEMDRGEQCPGKFRVFDGRRRYDLNFSVGGSQVLDLNSSGIFSGSTQKCLMFITRISGFRKKVKSSRKQKKPHEFG